MDAILFPEDDPIENWRTYTWWIGTVDDVPICYCGLQLLEDYAYMVRSGVLAEYQGQGLQKKMIKRRLEYCTKKGINKVVTDTVCDNPASMNSLISSGFKVYEPAEGWRGEGTVYWMWENKCL